MTALALPLLLRVPLPELAVTGYTVAGVMFCGCCVFAAVWGVGKWLEARGK